MPTSRPNNPLRIPSYTLHRASGRAVVRIFGKDHYLGAHGSTESWARYHTVIADYLSGKLTPVEVRQAVTVDSIAAQFLAWAERNYQRRGTASWEWTNFRDAFRPLREMFGHLPAEGFSPQCYKAVRERMIQHDGLARSTINSRCRRIRALFAWACAEGIIITPVHERLRAVPSLRAGRSEAPDPVPVRPVPLEQVNAIKPHVSRSMWAMIQVQLLSGMRPGEVVRMRAIDLDMREQAWRYVPERHKTQYMGKSRVIFLGPKAREWIEPLITKDLHQHIFLSRYRKAYTVNGYGCIVRRACQEAGIVPEWGPNRLRHTAATMIRRELGLESAQAVLGHTRVETTQVYAEVAMERAEQAALRFG